MTYDGSGSGDIAGYEPQLLNAAKVFDLSYQAAADLAGVSPETVEAHYESTDRKTSSVSTGGDEDDVKASLIDYFFRFRDPEDAAEAGKSNIDDKKYRLKLEVAGVYPGPNKEDMETDERCFNRSKLLDDTKDYEVLEVDPKAAVYGLMDETEGVSLEDISDFMDDELDFWRGNPSQGWRYEDTRGLLIGEAESYSRKNIWYRVEEEIRPYTNYTEKIYMVKEGFSPLATVSESERQLIRDKVDRWLSNR